MARKLEVVITGDTKSLENAYNRAGGATQSLGAKIGSMARTAGVALAGIGAVAGLKSIIDDTLEWGGAVVKLSRELGVTSEAASEVAYMGRRFGIEVESLSRGFGILGKDVAGGGEKLTKWGISAKNADGSARPFRDILGDIADKAKEGGAGWEDSAMAMELFGRSGKDLLPILLQGGEGLEALAVEAEELGLVLDEEATGEVKKMKKEMRELDSRMLGLKLSIGTAALPALERLADFTGNHLTPILITLGTIATITATKIAVSWAMSAAAAATSIAVQVAAMSFYARYWVVVGAAATANAAKIAAAWAIAALGVSSAFETIAIAAMYAGGAIVAALTSTAAIIAGVVVVAAALGAAIAYVFWGWDEMPGWAKVLATIGAIVTPIGQIVGLIYVLTHLGAVWEWLQGIAATVWGAIVSSLSTAVSAIASSLSTAVSAIVAFPGRLLGVGAAILEAVVGGLKQAPYVIGYVIGYAAGILVMGAYRLVTAIASGIAAIPGIVASIFWGAVNAIAGAVSAAVGVVATFIPQIPGIVAGALSVLPGIAWGALAAMAGAVAGGVGWVVGTIAGLPGQILGAIGDLGSLLYGAGQAVVQGLINGITSMTGAAWDAISGLAGGLKDGFLSAIGASSPSRVFAAIAEYVPQGVALGIEKTAHTAVAAVRNMAAAMVSGAPAVTSAMTGLVAMPSPTIAAAGYGGGKTAGQVNVYIDPAMDWLRGFVRVEVNGMAQAAIIRSRSR